MQKYLKCIELCFQYLNMTPVQKGVIQRRILLEETMTTSQDSTAYGLAHNLQLPGNQNSSQAGLSSEIPRHEEIVASKASSDEEGKSQRRL